jgi:hypothetical protein
MGSDESGMLLRGGEIEFGILEKRRRAGGYFEGLAGMGKYVFPLFRPF